MQIIEQTPEEKMAMYMKCTKKELCSMLIECNRILDLHIKAANPFSWTIGNAMFQHYENNDTTNGE